MLTLIMIVLIAADRRLPTCYGAPATRYISLFPMVILTGMVERFWTLETEDSTTASFRTLLQTMLIATVIALVLSRPRAGAAPVPLSRDAGSDHGGAAADRPLHRAIG